ncbi:MAG: hypothetical protein ACREMY_06160, partial [bacterium]
RISTTCSWVNMLGGPKAAIIARVGQFYSDAVGQYYSGANTFKRALRQSVQSLLLHCHGVGVSGKCFCSPVAP